MNNEEVRNLVEDLEAWVKFHSKAPIHLIDVSRLLSILRRYYTIKSKGGIK